MNVIMRILAVLAFLVGALEVSAQRTLVSASSQFAKRTYTPASVETYSAWVRPTSAGGAIIATTRGAVADNHYRLMAATLTTAYVSERAGVSYESTTNITRATNTWFHVAGVFRGNTYRRIYVDGVPATANTTSVTPTSIDEVWLGRIQTSSGNYYASTDVAEVAIWHAELTDAEIGQLAAGGQFTRRAHPSKIRPDKLVWLPDLSIPGAAVPGIGGVTGISNSPAQLNVLPATFK